MSVGELMSAEEFDKRHQSPVETKIKDISTDKLVEKLITREGIEMVYADHDDAFTVKTVDIHREIFKTRMGIGPATILIIRD